MSSEEKRELTVEQAAYGEYVDKAINLTHNLQVSHLRWYWEMGDLVSKFMANQAAKKFGEKNLDTFAVDLKGHMNGVEIGTSTLYCARSINVHYKLEQLDDMVKRGVTVGHLKLLIPLKDEQKTEVAKKLYGADGRAITIKQLDEAISETARRAAQESVAKAAETVKARPTPPAPPTASEEPVGAPEATAPEGSDAPPATPVVDDGKSGTRGATPQKEFSQPPLKALKTFDNVATKLIACTGDALIAVNEGVKVGFDSDKAQKNFRDAFHSAQAATRDVLETCKQLLATMDEIGKDI